MSTGLRTTFWLHAIVAFVLGAGLVFLPAYMADLFEIDPFDPIVTRLFGAATLGLCASSVLAAPARRWEQVTIVAQTELVFTVLGALVCLYAVLFDGASVMLWWPVAMFVVFFLLFGYFYLQERTAHIARPGTPAVQ